MYVQYCLVHVDIEILVYICVCMSVVSVYIYIQYVVRMFMNFCLTIEHWTILWVRFKYQATHGEAFGGPGIYIYTYSI